ncbi:MAG: hypothetical protein L0L95_14175 [Staphylococcus equorum]|nr:hypothetical protein [Staphylococcus equorum]
MKVEELLKALETMGVQQNTIKIQDEPSYSTQILQDLEKKYHISTKHVVNNVLSLQSLYEISELTENDYELWIDTYEDFVYFEGNEAKINNIPISSSIGDYINELDDTQVESEYESKKEDIFMSSFFGFSC